MVYSFLFEPTNIYISCSNVFYADCFFKIIGKKMTYVQSFEVLLNCKDTKNLFSLHACQNLTFVNL